MTNQPSLCVKIGRKGRKRAKEEIIETQAKLSKGLEKSDEGILKIKPQDFSFISFFYKIP